MLALRWGCLSCRLIKLSMCFSKDMEEQSREICYRLSATATQPIIRRRNSNGFCAWIGWKEKKNGLSLLVKMIMKMPILNPEDGVDKCIGRWAIILLDKEVTGHANRFWVRLYSSHCSATGHLHKCAPTQNQHLKMDHKLRLNLYKR